MCHYPFSLRQINEMGQYVAGRGAHEAGRGVGVDARGERRGVGGAIAECRADRLFAGAPMRDQLGNARLRVLDRGAVARMQALHARGGKAVERHHVGPHVAVRRRDQR